MSRSDNTHLLWWKSSRSSGQGGACVEVAASGGAWFVRDSKDPQGGRLRVSPVAWAAFLELARTPE